MKREHGSTSGDPNAMLDRLFELTGLLSEEMARSLGARGLTRARAAVVWRLFHQGPMTQRRLSAALRVTPRNVTGLLDALEEGGFVARSPHPTDRRATLVTITAKGRTAAHAMHEDHEEFAARLFAGLPAKDLRVFDAVLDHVLELCGRGNRADRIGAARAVDAGDAPV